MAPTYSFSPKTTSVSFPWPSSVTAFERIFLSAQGELQRNLSAYFARPISVVLVYSKTYSHRTPGSPVLVARPTADIIASASGDTPITQSRQIQLRCAEKTVCTATSTVRITSPHCAHLFLEEKYPIGQMFRMLAKLPQFELLEVGFGLPPDSAYTKDDEAAYGDRLWRRYKLVVPEFECEILEEFPSRDMFVYGEDWLLDRHVEGSASAALPRTEHAQPLRTKSGMRALAILGFMVVAALQLLILFTSHSAKC